MVEGEKLHDAFVGRFEQEKETAPLKPLLPVSDKLNVPGVWLVTVRLPEGAVKLKLPAPLEGCATVIAATTPSLPPLMPAAM